jgi:Sulfotransferase family
MKNQRSSAPTFVIGIWRSGTSLLYTLLNQHPEIALMYEGDLLLLRPLFSRSGGKRDWLKRWEFWNSALSRHHIQTRNLPSVVPDIASGALAVWREYGGGAAVIGEKSPDYFDSLQEVAREFPGARFIIIWRDPADICRSIIRASKGSSFFSKPGINHRALIGSHKLKQECDALISQNIGVHQLDYVDLVRDPERVMAGICEFLQIPFDSRMCSLRGSDRSVIYEGSHHELVKQETIHSSITREEVLPPRLKQKIEHYVAWWKTQYAGTWPRYSVSSETGRYPTALERAADQVLFRALRVLDKFTAFVYCYAPISLLEKYRSFKNRRYQNEAVEKPTQDIPAKPLPTVEMSETK